MVFIQYTDSSAVMGTVAHHSLQLQWLTDHRVCHVLNRTNGREEALEQVTSVFSPSDEPLSCLCRYQCVKRLSSTSLTSRNTLLLAFAFPSTTSINFR